MTHASPHTAPAPAEAAAPSLPIELNPYGSDAPAPATPPLNPSPPFVHPRPVATRPAPPPAPPPAALDAIRTAIRGFGYEHLDLAQGTPRAASSDAPPLDAGIAQVRIGGAERRGGDCATATATWRAALPLLAQADDTAASAPWRVRALFGIGLCALSTGDFAAALAPLADVAHGGETPTLRREARFAMGTAYWQVGRTKDARVAFKSSLAGAADDSDPVRAAFHVIYEPLGITPQ